MARVGLASSIAASVVKTAVKQLAPPRERRSGRDRRSGADRRDPQALAGASVVTRVWASIDRRSGGDRRSGLERRI